MRINNNLFKVKICLLISILFLTSSALHSGRVDIKKPKRTITHVTLTCYQPLSSQCDDSPLITADGSKINLNKLEKGDIKWCAISRDLLWLFPKDRPKRVYIEGHGVYEVRDKMNKKWEHRIDILIHPKDQTRFCKRNVKVTILN